MYQQICRNLPGYLDWQGSFYERLAEYGDWFLRNPGCAVEQ